MKGRADQLLVEVRTTDVARVDKDHGFGDDLAYQRDTTVVVGVLGSDLRPGELHRSVTDACDGEVTPNGDRLDDAGVLAHVSQELRTMAPTFPVGSSRTPYSVPAPAHRTVRPRWFG